MMQKILSSRLTTVALIGLVTLLAVHVFATNTQNLRADLTADDLYSLSEGTDLILERMQSEGVKPIDLKLYFSETAGKSLPKFIKDFVVYNKYVRALLQEYEVAGKGKLRVSFIDPLPDSDDAQDALDYGLDGKPINQHGDLFFFGLVFETQTGSKDVIDFLWPAQQESIEYEISKHIHTLVWPEQKRVGVLSSLEVLSDASNPYMAQILAAQGKQPKDSWLALKLLEETYDVSKIDPNVDTISKDDFDLVLVIHPKSLPEKTLFALDEWIVKGGNALFFLDPYAIDDQPPQNPQQPWAAMQYEPSSNAETLLAAWGLTRPEGQVAADFDLAVTRPVSRRGPAERVLVDLAIDPESKDATLAQGHPIFQGLNDLRFFMAGSLERAMGPAGENGEAQPLEIEGVSYTPLISTTPQGNTLPMQAGFPSGGNLVFNDVSNPTKLVDAFRHGEKPVILAYAIQGKLPSAFPAGGEFSAAAPPPPPPGMPPGFQMPPQEGGEMVTKEPVPDEERAESTVVVVADVDMLSDQVAFQQSLFGVAAANDNYAVLLNAIDFLQGSEELMKVRAKQPIERPFTLFDKIEAQADRDTLERERQLRAEIDRFQQELSDKQGGMGSSNAALFQKQLQDEVAGLNERIAEASRELREIRKSKRAALEKEEAKVRFATLWTMPSLVLAFGLGLFFRRKNRDRDARGTR